MATHGPGDPVVNLPAGTWQDLRTKPERFQLSRRVSLQGFRIEVRSACITPRGYLKIGMTVADSETGEPIELNFTEGVPPGHVRSELDDERLLAEAVRQILVCIMTHEVTELVMLDGKPLEDQHPEYAGHRRVIGEPGSWLNR